MASFFHDNEDLRFYAERGIDWASLVEVTEYLYRAPGGPKDAAEAKSFYLDILGLVGELAAEKVAPFAAEIDREGVKFEGGEAHFPPRLQSIFDEIRALELHGMCMPRELGGQNCPLTVFYLSNELLGRADISVMAHHSFHGAIAMAMLVYSMLEGSTEVDVATGTIVKTRFAKEMEEIRSGRAWGAMDITEPNAGSDMAALRAFAEQDEQGNWFVTGQKIFITSGHGKYHFVIARTEKASDRASEARSEATAERSPAGRFTRPDPGSNDLAAGLGGLSMFLVETYSEDEAGNRTRTVSLDRLEEKLGHHGSATAALTFERAPARLVGERGEGFKYMLTLMNGARIGVGFESIGLAESALRLAKAYAAERRSMGKSIDRHEMIADYLDEMESDLQGLRAMAVASAVSEELATKTKLLIDRGFFPDAAERERREQLVSRHRHRARRFTPLLKYLAAEKSVEICRRAVQIHGGAGYTADYGAEKLLRDAIVMPIYEGTSQIQSLMAMRDTLMGAMKSPSRFAKRVATAKLREVSARDPLERRVARLESLSLSAQQHLLARTATDKYRALKGQPLTEWRERFMKHWDPKKDFAYAMLHAESLTRLLADEAIAELLLEQAKDFPERRAVLERAKRCDPTAAVPRGGALARLGSLADRSRIARGNRCADACRPAPHRTACRPADHRGRGGMEIRLEDYVALDTIASTPPTELVRMRPRHGGDELLVQRLSAGTTDPRGLIELERALELLRRRSFRNLLPFVGRADDGGLPAIVFTPVEGRSLAVHARMSHDDELELAERLADALDELHTEGVVLGNVAPQSFFWTEQQIFVSDLSHVIRDAAERSEPSSPWLLRGSLAHLAPEQTGRTQRSIDHRADYYGLGVLLYERLTGVRPFEGDDALELVYRHLAMPPPPLQRHAPGLPPFVSGIVLKLLEKDPDRRYQSIEGLRADLRLARELVRGERPPPPLLGSFDVPHRPSASHRLYGRERERAQLLDAFERACAGRRELLVLSGYSGSGKTSLIRETYLPITRRRAFFVTGKFDQLQRRVPYRAWVQALGKLVEFVLAEPEGELETWRSRISEALGANAGVVTPVIPGLETLLGPCPPPPALPATEARVRFEDAFRRFMLCFCRPERPLFVFLDDLQWIDAASLGLFERLAVDAEVRHFFLVGAFRDNEVPAAHPVALALQRIRREAPLTVTELSIGPLGVEDSTTLVADLFATTPEQAHPLAEVLVRKTAGNPFFLWQMLHTLRVRRSITLDAARIAWTWRLPEIEAIDYADSVVELMVQRFDELPGETRRTLGLAALLGAEFELDTLALVTGRSRAETFASLEPALREEFVRARSDEELVDGRIAVRRLRFTHDRMQEAAHRSIGQEERVEVHHHIARALLEDPRSSGAESDRLFQIVDHLNVAEARLSTRAELLELARLNLEAALRARHSAAWDAALGYLRVGMARLPEDLWDTERALARDLFRERGELEYLAGDFDEAEAFVKRAIAQETDDLRRADFVLALVVQYTLRADYPRAIAAAREGLARFGITLPEGDFERARDAELDVIRRLVAGRSWRALGELPPMRDPVQQAVMRLLTSMGPPCYRSHPRLWGVIVARELRLCLEHGAVPAASYGFPAFGGLLTHVGLGSGADCEALYAATKTLMEQSNSPADTSVGHLMIGSSLRHWFAPLADASRDYLAAYTTGLESGNLQYAAYGFGHNAYCSFFQGVPLDDLAQQVEGYLKFSARRKNLWAIDLTEGVLRVIRRLASPEERSDQLVDVEQAARCEAHGNVQVSCILSILETEAAIHLGDWGAAASALDEATRRIDSVSTQGLYPVTQYHLMRALVSSSAPGLLGISRADARKELRWARSRFEQWAEHAPASHDTSKWLLIAEEACLDGDLAGAMDGYDRAIDAAERAGLGQRAALAAIRAAEAWRDREKPHFARLYVERAIPALTRWRATAVLASLERRALAPAPRTLRDRAVPYTSTLEALDLDLVGRTAQSLARHLSIDDLLATALETVMRLSGAQRAVVLVANGDALLVAADSDQSPRALARPWVGLEASSDVPRALVQLVARTATSLRITPGDQVGEPGVAEDPSLRDRGVHAALSVPLIAPGGLTGVIHLEHRSTLGAFDPRTVRLVELVAAQTAVALRNATLFEALQREIAEKKRTEETLRDAMMQAEQASRAKSEFLASMSHEIRTPMNGVLGIAELLDGTPLSPEQRAYVSTIRESGNALLSIIGGILDFSKIEAGRIELESLPFDLAHEIDEVLRLLGPRAKMKGLELRGVLPERLPVIGDPVRLRQVVTNLVGNAVKFTSSGSATVVIESAPAGPGARRVRVEVRDTGIGIAPGQQELLFRAFTQLDGSTTRRFGGTGLGLAISKRLVEAMGGRMGVISSLGVGATFWFEVVLPEADVTPVQRGAQASEARLERFSGRVLVAEDNVVNLKVVRQMLERLGLDVVPAEDGRRALELAGEHSFSMFVFDLHMPELDGFALTRAVRARENGHHTPIVALTADVMPEDRARCLAAGMDDFLTKPLRRDELVDVLLRWLPGARRQRSPSAT
ncbi:AAA family ATPase [Myxococcota bacterium]|nr:AAA family ATPase [Myxococcota bacterium]